MSYMRSVVTVYCQIRDKPRDIQKKGCCGVQEGSVCCVLHSKKGWLGESGGTGRHNQK